MILIALMCARIPPGFDNVKRFTNYQTFQTPFYSGFESTANIVFPFETDFGQTSCQGHHTVATIKGN